MQNFIALIISSIYSFFLIIFLIKGENILEFVRGLRYIATCGLVSTMFIFIVFLGAGKKVSITKDDFVRNFNPKLANLILHYIVPILSCISFIFFEREIIVNDGICTMLVAAPSCIYWIIYIILSSLKVWKEPYNFSVKKSKFLEVLIMILIPFSYILISILLWNVK